MRDRGDRLLLRGRVVVSAEAADQPAVPGLQPAADPDGGPGGLDQPPLDVGAGVAGPPVLALARAYVVARAQGDPRGGSFPAGVTLGRRGSADGPACPPPP